MFAKGWLKVALLVVGVLVVSLGMYVGFQVQDVEAHPHPGKSCSEARWDCCSAVQAARQICGTFPDSSVCANQAEWVNFLCSIAAAVCGSFSCSSWG